MAEQGDGFQKPAAWTLADIVGFLKQHKIWVAGVLTPVIATELTSVVGPVVRWAIRGVLLALAVLTVSILYIRRRGMWTRSRRRMNELAERFRPVYEPPADAPATEDQPASEEPRRGRWRKVLAISAAILSVAAVAAAAVVVTSKTDGTSDETPGGTEVAASPDVAPTYRTPSPSGPVSFVGESIAGVMRDLRADGVSVEVDIRIDPAERPGTIVEQAPNPLPLDASSIDFVVTGRPYSVELDKEFVVAGGGSWREGPQRIFGSPYDNAFFLRDGDCLSDTFYCDFDPRSPTLALNLGRQFEIFSATLGFDERSRVTSTSTVDVLVHGVGAEEGETVCTAHVGPTTRPLRLRLDVSGIVRLEIVFRPWRGRQIPAVGKPTATGVNSGLLSPPATRYKNLLPVPDPNPRCFE